VKRRKGGKGKEKEKGYAIPTRKGLIRTGVRVRPGEEKGGRAICHKKEGEKGGEGPTLEEKRRP